MNIVERSRSLPIIFSTLLVGLSPLIPIPVVDDLITAALCRWRVKYLAAQYGLTLNKEEIKTLADLQQVGCLGGAIQSTLGYTVRAFFQNLLFWLEASRVAIFWRKATMTVSCLIMPLPRDYTNREVQPKRSVCAKILSSSGRELISGS